MEVEVEWGIPQAVGIKAQRSSENVSERLWKCLMKGPPSLVIYPDRIVSRDQMVLVGTIGWILYLCVETCAIEY